MMPVDQLGRCPRPIHEQYATGSTLALLRRALEAAGSRWHRAGDLCPRARCPYRSKPATKGYAADAVPKAGARTHTHTRGVDLYLLGSWPECPPLSAFQTDRCQAHWRPCSDLNANWSLPCGHIATRERAFPESFMSKLHRGQMGMLMLYHWSYVPDEYGHNRAMYLTQGPIPHGLRS